MGAVATSAGAQRHDASRDTIGRGRPATCLVDDPTRARCTFSPRNGDGSFMIDTAAGRYLFDHVGPDRMSVDYDNGARFVRQGEFVRSRDDRACWVRRPDRRICAW